MMGAMTIGQLAARTGLSVRTLRFYADAGVLPEAGRSEAGYRLFAADAVARARLVRTLRELGVGLGDVKRVLAAEVSLTEVATAHASAIDAQIRTLRLQLAVLRAVARSTEPKELELMTHLTKLTSTGRRRRRSGAGRPRRLPADLRHHGSHNQKSIRRARWRRPAQPHLIAHSARDKSGDGLGQFERRRKRRPRAGASGQRQQRSRERNRGCKHSRSHGLGRASHRPARSVVANTHPIRG